MAIQGRDTNQAAKLLVQNLYPAAFSRKRGPKGGTNAFAEQSLLHQSEECEKEA
jgi:hypothetical protein